MTSLLGTLALSAAVVVALAAAVAWCRVAVDLDRSRRVARAATWGTLAAAAGAVALLEHALVTRDFSVRYVAEHGGLDVPLYFTVTSLWAALEGSLLLWLLVLTGYAAAAAARHDPRAAHLHPWVLVVLSLATAFFAALALAGGNPFDPVAPVPVDGPGPNPLLRNHWLMALHPPLLYLGYVGLAVPFAYALAALLTGETGRGWLLAARRWTLLAWTFLTAGVVLGAWWSYAVLGWGGYWAWDPVENASLLPWLTTTALLHTAAVQERRATLRVWNLTLALAGFVLVLVGTFLTRSGVVASVHAFSGSLLGPVLLGAVAVVLATSAGLLVWRAERLGPPAPVELGPSRETAALGGAVLLVGLAGVVLLGTVFPVLVEVASGDLVSVGPPYFNRMAVPVVLALLVLMAAGPVAAWGGSGWRPLAGRLALPAALGVAGAAGSALAGLRDIRAVLAVGLALLVVATAAGEARAGVAVVRRGTGRRAPGALVEAARRRPRLYGGLLAHTGIALAAVAVAVSATSSVHVERRVEIGESLAVGDWTVTLTGIERSRAEGAMAVAARLRLERDGRPAGEAAPRLRAFPAHATVVAEPVVRSSWSGDLYLTVTGAQETGAAVLRAAVNPMVPWLWVAGGLVTAGGALALWPRRRAPRGHGAPGHGAPGHGAPARGAPGRRAPAESLPPVALPVPEPLPAPGSLPSGVVR